MSLKSKLLRFYGVYNYDRKGEADVLKAIRTYRKGGSLNRIRAQRMYIRNIKKYRISIHPDLEVGKNFHLVHADSIRIGEGVKIGDNCKIYPYAHIMGSLKADQLVDGVYKKACIGNDVIVGAGSAIVGAVTVGDDVTIGAHAVVTKDVPPHSVVVGVNVVRPKRESDIPEKYRNTVEAQAAPRS